MNANYSSPLAAEISPDLLDRFTRYVQIDTQSQRGIDRSPSTPGQLQLGRLLADELRDLGLTDASLDPNGYVTATLASSDGAGLQSTELTDASFGLIAHLDTTPDAPGAGVKPIVHRAYDGGVIELPLGTTRLDPAEMAVLASKAGHDIVTASGDTLLGADDKAGVAAIMSAVAYLAAHADHQRPAVRVAFTPDEEIGAGARLLDIPAFGVKRAYTLDGSTLGTLEDESFSAVEVVLTITGVDIHPGQATGRMVSALRLVAEIVAALPSDRLTPDTTAGRDGFIHPNQLRATTASAELRAIVRDFDEDELASHVALLERIAMEVVARHPRATLDFQVHRQYRNMRSAIEREPEVMAAAEEAIRAEGIEPVRTLIRGGTDGSQLSLRGLPTPNLFTGGHEFHSLREWASVQDMATSAATIVRLADAWAHRVGLPA